MTPEEQRVAIAEACGIQTRRFRFWYTGHDRTKPYRTFDTRELAEENRQGEIKWGCGEVEEFQDLSRVPKFLSDLNACHEFEKTLTNSEKTDYIRALNKGDFSFRRLAFATAAQRCEAFLRTKGIIK